MKQIYDNTIPIENNGSTRPGQGAWHNAGCEIQILGMTHTADGIPYRDIWCVTHGQWTHEYPMQTQYHFADGTIIYK